MSRPAAVAGSDRRAAARARSDAGPGRLLNMFAGNAG